MATINSDIELNQGCDHLGRTFGYDHSRKNFITWDIECDKIIVVKVENDDQETGHGSIADTRRDAEAVASRETKLPNGELRRAIRQRFARD